MSGRPISAEHAAELNWLFQALPDAITHAGKALREFGALDDHYVAEDAKVAHICDRIDQLMNEP